MRPFLLIFGWSWASGNVLVKWKLANFQIPAQDVLWFTIHFQDPAHRFRILSNWVLCRIWADIKNFCLLKKNFFCTLKYSNMHSKYVIFWLFYQDRHFLWKENDDLITRNRIWILKSWFSYTALTVAVFQCVINLNRTRRMLQKCDASCES